MDNLNINIKDITNTTVTTMEDTRLRADRAIDLKMHINYIKTREDAIEPTRGSAAAAGHDLYVPSLENEIPVPVHSTVKVHTGIAIALPEGTFGAIFARSGLATKQGLRPANCVGVVDSDYRGEVIVALHNDTDDVQSVKGGDRIAQLIIMPYMPITLDEVVSLDETERGEDGFGSTGV